MLRIGIESPPGRRGEEKRERADQVPAAGVRDPDPLGQPARRPGAAPEPPASPGHAGAPGARRPRPPLPHGADRAGGFARPRDRDPRPGPRDLQALAPDAAPPRMAT